jgi:hypothetical protein
MDTCQCDACKDGVIHSSDCAVHNEPTEPAGTCSCGAERRAKVLSRWSALKPRDRDRWLAEAVAGIYPPSLEQAVDEFDKSCCIWLNEDGASASSDADLVFNRAEYDEKFGSGYWRPTRKQWLLDNAQVRMKYRWYTKDPRSAFDLAKKVNGCLHLREHGEEGHWEAEFCEYPGSKAHGDTPEEAICLAALLAEITGNPERMTVEEYLGK